MSAIETQPDGRKKVTLARPLVSHAGEVRAVVLREPSYADFFELGDPTAVVFLDGAKLPQVDQAIVRRYVERCADVDVPVLEQIRTLGDAMALSRAMIDFFLTASGSISTGSPTPS